MMYFKKAHTARPADGDLSTAKASVSYRQRLVLDQQPAGHCTNSQGGSRASEEHDDITGGCGNGFR